jgi:hypothetical protein
VRQIQVAAHVGERIRQRLGTSGPHSFKALTDSLQGAGFLSVFLLAKESHGRTDGLVKIK